MGYRPDIDGLRALAVSAVVLFHAGIGLFSGGFVGVDVFFVISGYLITAIIAREMETGSFSIAGFYLRRIRRIVPALVAMLAATAVAAFLVLAPSDFGRFGVSLVAAALSVSNVYFWQQTGYFDSAAEEKPLLHTWSLSVEEQFYLVLPAVLAATRLVRRDLAVPVYALIGLSFAVSLVEVRTSPSAAFFLLPARGWELLLGAAVAVGRLPAIRPALLGEAAAAAGLALILVPVFALDGSTRFPGEGALMPCIGTALLIWSGRDGGPTRVARLLSLRPVVFLGLISYSLYLWHWPLIVLTRYHLGEMPGPAGSVLLVIASILLAILSWRFVEQPFRRLGNDRRGAVFAAAGAGIAAVSAAGAAIVLATSRPALIERLYGPEIAAVQAIAVADPPREGCENHLLAALRERGCLVGAPGTEPSIAIIGDSFAETIAVPLDRALRQAGLSAAPYIYFSCPAIAGTTRTEALQWAPGFVSGCRSYLDRSLAEILANPAIRHVVIANNYDWYLNRPSTVTGGPVLTADGVPEPENRQGLLRQIEATVALLAGSSRTVIFLGSSPSGHEEASAERVMRDLRAGRLGEDQPIAAAHCTDWTRPLAEAAERRHGERFAYVDVASEFARASGPGCAMTRDRLPLTIDGNHVSSLVTARLVPKILAAIDAPEGAIASQGPAGPARF